MTLTVWSVLLLNATVVTAGLWQNILESVSSEPQGINEHSKLASVRIADTILAFTGADNSAACATALQWPPVLAEARGKSCISRHTTCLQLRLALFLRFQCHPKMV
jgi:hypothetical protein